MSEWDRICTLSLDETSLSKKWTYDRSPDRLYDPKRNVFCVMIRGLTARWKQLLFYDFDITMTKDLLFNIIEKAEAAGFLVTAMVSDMAQSNVSLWHSLGVSTTNTSIPNPVAPARKVFVFPDAPHLIKLIRNNLLDKGFLLHGGKRVSSDCLRKLVERSTKDLKPAHKLVCKTR